MRKSVALLALMVLGLLPALAQTNQIHTNPPAIAATKRPVPVLTNPPAVLLTNSAPIPRVVITPTQAAQTDLPMVAPTNTASGTATALPDCSKYASFVISLLALGYTIWKDRKTEKRMKAIEAEQEREKKEAAIRRSKASAPYFSPSNEMFNILYESNEDGGLAGWTFDDANVLTPQQKEMPKDAPEGTPVIIILKTNGKGARRIRISGDISGFELKQEPETHGGEGRVFLKYPYRPSQHGKTQTVILSFETEDGFDLTHSYKTRHGCFEFYRVDPK